MHLSGEIDHVLGGNSGAVYNRFALAHPLEHLQKQKKKKQNGVASGKTWGVTNRENGLR